MGGRLLALISAVLLVGAEPHSFVVTIENVQFSPATLKVHRGDTIVWVNKDLFPHTVTAEGKAFDSHDIAPDASWSYHAVKSGDFTYTCIYHPTMKAHLSVQ